LSENHSQVTDNNHIDQILSMKTPLEVIQNLDFEFGLDSDFKRLTAHEHEDTLSELKHILADRILELLRKDHAILLNILYRIDINEEKVKEALSSNFLEDAAKKLTDLVIQRQMQKYINKKGGKL
jgi:hypothetical protein